MATKARLSSRRHPRPAIYTAARLSSKRHLRPSSESKARLRKETTRTATSSKRSTPIDFWTLSEMQVVFVRIAATGVPQPRHVTTNRCRFCAALLDLLASKTAALSLLLSVTAKVTPSPESFPRRSLEQAGNALLMSNRIM